MLPFGRKLFKLFQDLAAKVVVVGLGLDGVGNGALIGDGLLAGPARASKGTQDGEGNLADGGRKAAEKGNGLALFGDGNWDGRHETRLAKYLLRWQSQTASYGQARIGADATGTGYDSAQTTLVDPCSPGQLYLIPSTDIELGANPVTEGFH
jgi:hypothetical protein